MSEKIDLADRFYNASSEILDYGVKLKKKTLLENIVPKDGADKHNSKLIHIHDLEFYDVTYNCIGVSINDIINENCKNFSAMMNALNRGIIDLTNNQSGGIGFINFDSDASVYIKEESDREIKRCIREFFLNMNVNSRKGCERPYVTLNFGLDTSVNGRKLSLLMLEAYEEGDEKGCPFVFPNIVFKMKSNVNTEPDSPNFDIYKKALSVTAKRMVPTYLNCDCDCNLGCDPDKLGIMGCRTRVVSNINGENGALNRGNAACITLNLVQIAYRAKHDTDKFYEILNDCMKSAEETLIHRFETLCNKWNFSGMGNINYYMGCKSKNARKMFENGTLSIGFIGLWDAVDTLFGNEAHTIEDIEKYYDDGFKIIKYMREYTDSLTKKYGLNFSLLASSAEGVTGFFAGHDIEVFGDDFKACQKGYYVNSFHIPVYIKTDYIRKINVECAFHKLCSGGAITYVELEDAPINNTEAVQEIIEYAYKKGCGYIGINFPLDNCKKCGYTGILNNKCPECGSGEIRRLRRVSGYLAEEDKFTKGKTSELKDRTAHLITGFK